MPTNLPTNLLRSFVAIVDAGTMRNASDRVFVTQAALSVQIRRLEELVQQELFQRTGRRLTITPAGELLLDYARKMLALNDEAVATVAAGSFSGPIRVGMVQDFADSLLSGLFAQFAELHPEAQVFARVAGTDELLALLDRQQIDIVLGFSHAEDPRAIARAKMEWFGDPALLRADVIPLAVVEEPCRFRAAAIRALDEAGRPYRIAVETPNLSTMRAAVSAGLGLTCRTRFFVRDQAITPPSDFPALPEVTCILEVSDSLNSTTDRLATLTRQAIAAF